jgi:threonine synthase
MSCSSAAGWPDPSQVGAPIEGWRSYLRAIECTACHAEFDADTPQGVCPSCGKVLFARYDLTSLKSAVTPDDLRGRPWDMWRYRELLPVREPEHVVTLGEGMTPLLRISEHVRIKDEGQNPTGSFKSRGMAAAISRAPPPGSKRTSRSPAMSRPATWRRCEDTAPTSCWSMA